MNPCPNLIGTILQTAAFSALFPGFILVTCHESSVTIVAQPGTMSMRQLANCSTINARGFVARDQFDHQILTCSTDSRQRV